MEEEPLLMLWVNGRTRMEEEVAKVEKQFESDLKELNKRLSKFHVKKIKSKEYWYELSANGKWIYLGAVKKKDPQIQILKEISKLEQTKKMEVEKVRKCVVKELGEHLIINYNAYQPFGEELIPVYEILKTVKEAISGKP
ncbi:hypothetical protein HY570_02085 [Candidatus Micrarchaeota archaeon]|nr:hypothetical protein [Candidatus Micrarchaeota archaeon]